MSKECDKLKETMIKVRLKRAFAPLPLGGAGRGAQLPQREKQVYSCAPAFRARNLCFGIDLKLRPSSFDKLKLVGHQTEPLPGG